MGTLGKLRLKMKLDKDFRKMLVRGTRNEILIDIDGDKQADIALMDTVGDGNIDTLAVDITGDGLFDLYFSDTDANGIPDAIYYDESGSGDLEIVACGKDVEESIMESVQKLEDAMKAEELFEHAVRSAYKQLEKDMKAAEKEIRKLK